MTYLLFQLSTGTNKGEKFNGAALLRLVGYLAFVATFVGIQTLSIWNYQGDKVDETELVHYAVGFLGGDLDPRWYIYAP